jgi:Type II secretion system (T2SS), protein E, N-terminal domain
LAMADPTDQDAIGLVRRKAQKRVRPAVAGPSEILRAVRTLYAAPLAGTSGPEQMGNVQLSAIEIRAADDSEQFEVVNVSEELGSPLSRIAKQLGVEVPANIASRTGKVPLKPQPAADDFEIPVDDSPLDFVTSSGGQPMGAIPPKTDPRLRRQRLPVSFDELFAPPPRQADSAASDLSPEDLQLIEAIRASLEKGASILRALAELCVEKGLFTREEMRKRNHRP